MAARCQWNGPQKLEGTAESHGPDASAVLTRAWLCTVFAKASERGLDVVAK